MDFTWSADAQNIWRGNLSSSTAPASACEQERRHATALMLTSASKRGRDIAIKANEIVSALG